jgi:uncharacterized surface protein with fasciclin (FAS1) repeats
MKGNIQLARRVTVALAAVVAPLALATSTAASSPPQSEVPAGDCAWVDQSAVADVSLLEATDQLSELSTFRAAVDASGFAEELGAVGPFTVFAPSNAAMNAIPENVFNAMLADPALLSSIVGQHIVVGQALTADQLVAAGTVDTRTGPVTVVADGAALQIGGKNVECGPIQTVDAVIYVIDGVLEPPSIGGGCPTGSSVPGSSTPASSTPMSSSPSSSAPGDSVPC